MRIGFSQVIGRVLTVCAVAGFSLAGLGQAAFGQVAFGQARGIAAPVKFPQQPYTAEFKTVSVKTLANGTTITREATNTRSIDSQGRTMNVTTTPATGERAAVTTV